MTSHTLLFGGSGFLGPVVLEKYPEIVSVGRTPPPSYVSNRHIPLPDMDGLEALDAVEFDKVIFLVGNSNHHILNQSTPLLAMSYNVTPLMKALHYLRNRRIKKFICLSGGLMYREHGLTLPIDESQPIDPYRNSYLFSKFVAEETTKLFAPAVPIINIRISNIYGPSKLIRPDLVPTMIQSALSPLETTVWSMKPQRDFLYTPDAAEAIVKLLDTDYTGNLNLGSGTMTSVGRVAEIVGQVSGKTIIDLDKPVTGPMKFQFDISLVNRLTGWTPVHTLEQGIQETYDRMKPWAAECRWWER